MAIKWSLVLREEHVLRASGTRAEDKVSKQRKTL
jgi:hypothetical protein